MVPSCKTGKRYGDHVVDDYRIKTTFDKQKRQKVELSPAKTSQAKLGWTEVAGRSWFSDMQAAHTA
jgi:hypothetical protein